MEKLAKAFTSCNFKSLGAKSLADEFLPGLLPSSWAPSIQKSEVAEVQWDSQLAGQSLLAFEKASVLLKQFSAVSPFALFCEVAAKLAGALLPMYTDCVGLQGIQSGHGSGICFSSSASPRT